MSYVSQPFSRAHRRQRNGQSYRIPMGNASRGHREHGLLSIADIPYVRTEKIVD